MTSAGIMRANGSQSQLLLPTQQTGPVVWSPDGERVALTWWEPDEGYSLYVLAAPFHPSAPLPCHSQNRHGSA
jgi:hypothetical protein